MTKNNRQVNCAYRDEEKGCRILSERLCNKKICPFFKTYERYKRDLETDYLFLSLQRGDITAERYCFLTNTYHEGRRNKDFKGV